MIAFLRTPSTPSALLMATNSSSPRTPSKTRGKAVTETQQQQVHKCQFDSDNTKLFLQLIIAEMEVGNRQPYGLSMTGYKNVANQFLDKTRLLHLAKQMKNKFDNLKKDWVAWKNLENASHGLTGLRYDHETGLFTTPDHWWAKMQAMNNQCAKFKTKPLEHLELMERVYSGAAANGKHAWTPTEVRNDAAAVTNANEDSEIEPLSVGTPPQLGHDTPTILPSSTILPRSQPRMDQPMQNVATGQRLVLSLVTWTTSWQQSINKARRDCLVRLMSTLGLEPSGKLFSFVCGIMDSPNNRDIIVALLVDYIVNWLIEKCAHTPANVGKDCEWGTQLFGSDGVVDLD
ncbi:unnamed protein product [Camellia sinensis]